MTQIERYEHNGYTVVIDSDEEGSNPREWDNLGTMLCWHRDYNLGDTGEPVDLIRRTLENHERPLSSVVVQRYLRIFYGATVVLPLALLDHSGITMRVGTSYAEDPGGWDTSRVGYIFDTTEGHAMAGVLPEFIEEVLRGEVASYATYIEGGQVGYTVLDQRGNVVESCWGFESVEEAKAQAEADVPTVADTSMTDAAALDALAALWSANEWNADLMDPTFRLLTSTGRKVTDPNEEPNDG